MEEIDFIVDEHHVSDAFMGLILVPLVEKAAEHLTGKGFPCASHSLFHGLNRCFILAVDEAWDDQMNFALAHCMGATIQTALFNSSLVVIVGWGLDKAMDLNFEVFNIVVLIMAIIVVGNFLRDQVGHLFIQSISRFNLSIHLAAARPDAKAGTLNQKSNYLEGALCILIYILIAVASWYYPNPEGGKTNTAQGGEVVNNGTLLGNGTLA